MNYFEYKCMASEEGCVPKCTVLQIYLKCQHVHNGIRLEHGAMVRK